MIPRRIVVGIAVLLIPASAGPARADRVTIGLYAPAAPFSGPSNRLAYIASLAKHLAPAAGGATVVGRVYARAGAFAAAVRVGEIQFAVIDAPYAAGRGLPYRVLASASRGGKATAAWYLVATHAINDLSDLRGKTVAAPRIGAKDTAFVVNVLLHGEVNARFFRKITWAPNSSSAAKMVSLGRADAAVVPAGTLLPSGVRRVLMLSLVGWPMFVALPRSNANMASAMAKLALSFRGSPFNTFSGADAGRYKSLVGRFGHAQKRPHMVPPKPARLAVRDLLVGRSFPIVQSDLRSLLRAPHPP